MVAIFVVSSFIFLEFLYCSISSIHSNHMLKVYDVNA